MAVKKFFHILTLCAMLVQHPLTQIEKMREYTLRQQLGNKGVYASIVFDVAVNHDQEPNLEFVYEADLRWKAACEAGAFIFFDYLSVTKCTSITIKVSDIKWLQVDTHHLVVLFATVKGLCEAFDLNPEFLDLDKQNEIFCFPEHRTRAVRNTVT